MQVVNILFLVGGILLFLFGLFSLFSESSTVVYVGALVCGPLMAIRAGLRLMNRE